MRGLLGWLAVALSACTDKGNQPSTDDSGGGGEEGGGAQVADADGDGSDAEEDCDDGDAAVYPGAAEACDEIDNNCDGSIDEGFNADGDASICDDCDDGNANVSPENAEDPYDGLDNDCDPATPDDDLDADGYPSAEDCDDADPAFNPAAAETPYDGLDQDCDGADLTDADGDGASAIEAGGEDCDDADASVRPGAVDFLNDGVDADCGGGDGGVRQLANAGTTVLGGTYALLGVAAAACDLDGDGLDDLAVAAPFDNGYAGIVGVFSGVNAGTWTQGMHLSDADYLLQGAEQFLGLGLACGDFDGDGQGDLAVGRGELNAPLFGYDARFEILLFSGAALTSTFSETAAYATLQFDLGLPEDTDGVGLVVHWVNLWSGDVDGDGDGELLLNMVRFYDAALAQYMRPNADGSLWVVDPYGASGLVGLDDYVAARIAPDDEDAVSDARVVPDWEGDGLPDLLIGQSGVSDEAGELFPGLLSLLPAADDGAAADLAYASYAGLTDELLGYQAIGGDFDGDGAGDVLASAAGGSTFAADAGALYLLSDVAATPGANLDPSGAAGEVEGRYATGLLGINLENLGDYDGDGAEDAFVVEAYGGSGGLGQVYAVSGAALSGADLDVQDTALLAWSAQTLGDLAAASLAAGDFDGDGFRDVALGAPYVNANNGQVYVLLSSQIGL